MKFITIQLLGRKSVIVSSLSLLLIIAVPIGVSAASQSYNVLSNSVQPGMLVSLTSNADVVAPATDKNADLLNGVVTNTTTDINQQPGQVSVENDGKAMALVSTLNGDIKVGDRISPSSIAGVGSRLINNGWIVGVAQASLNAQTKGAVASTVTDAKGGKHNIVIAQMPLIVRISYYGDTSTPANSAAISTVVPSSLQAAADALAGKHATLVGVLLSFLLIAIGVFLAGQIITSAVRSAFSAISRQPLSKAVVTRLVARSIAIALLLVAAVVGGAAILLRIF